MILQFALALLVGLAGPADATDAEAIMRAAHLKMYYPATDGRAVVDMVITDKRGKTREREFTILRRDLEEGGRQRYFVYFSAPNDVRRTTFMAWKDPEGNDARWIYVPALDLVKPLSASDKKSSFVGSDFSYEDVSGRHWTEDEHRLTGEVEYNGYQCDTLESTPRDKDYFARKLTWIDRASGLIVREEFYDSKNELLKVFEVEEIAEVDGHPTAVVRRMTTPRKDNVTVVRFSAVEYDAGIGEDIFSERYLKNPPSDLIR